MAGAGDVSRRQFLRLTGASGIGLAATSASGSLLAACSRDSGNPDTIKVGVMAPFSGSGQGIGAVVEDSLQAASREVNAGRGIDGRKVELLLRDTEDDAETTALVYRELVGTEGLLGILWCGAVGFAGMLPEIRRDRIPLVAVFEDPFSNGQLYPDAGVAGRSIFQMGVPDVLVKETLADYARHDRGYASAAMLYDVGLDGTYDTQGASRRHFDRAFGGAGLQVLAAATFESESEEGFAPSLAQLRAARPQVLYLDTRTDDAGPILQALGLMGAGYLDTPTAKGQEWRPHVFGSFRAINRFSAEAGAEGAATGAVTAWHMGGIPMLPTFAIGGWMRKYFGKDPAGGEELPADGLAALLNGLRRGGSIDRDRVVAGMETMGPVRFASLPFTFSAEEHYAPKKDDMAILTVEHLGGAPRTDPQYFLGAEWLEGGAYEQAGAATTLLVRPTLEANRRAHPDLVEEVLEQGLGTQCTKHDDGVLGKECKVH